MRTELRRSGGDTCSTCGSFELLHVDETPLATDLSRLLEVEQLRREVRLAQVFKEHLATVERGYAETLVNRNQQAMLEHGILLSEFDTIMSSIPLDVSAWHLFRKRRERRFKERVDAAHAELRERTRFSFSEPPKVAVTQEV